MISKSTSFNMTSNFFILSSPNHSQNPCYRISFGINPGNTKFSSRNPKVEKVIVCFSGERSEKNEGSLVTEAGSSSSSGSVDIEKVEPLWDDGYGTQTVKDCLEAARGMIVRPDGGPPRWFCPTESGPPLPNSPILLYLPGMDGVGMGLISHHKALGKVFEVRCLHIPVYDRTPFEELVKFIVKVVETENGLFPNRPIYLVGESFGGCLALSVAASCPTLDLVLVLVNPATSFNRSYLQPLLPLLKSFPEELHYILPYTFGLTLGDPIKMSKLNNLQTSPIKQLEDLLLDLSSLITGVSFLADILPKKTLIWKLKLIQSGAAVSNSRLHAIKAEALILASEKDGLLPSKLEAQRLNNIIKNCKVRFFKDSGHVLLMEDEVNLLSIIKGTSTYRRSKTRDFVKDFIPPSMSEFQYVFDQKLEFFRVATSPVLLSTLGNGEIVRGLEGIPDEGPVLLVGYHMLFGAEIAIIIEEFLREKKIMVHGAAHPLIFDENLEPPFPEPSNFDFFRVFGAIPVTPKNIFKLFSRKSFVLLYPGGIREALHQKHEAYKLFWPRDPEFVRMAARFGATIVPFGVVGEDDLFGLFLDGKDLMRIPFSRDVMKRRIGDRIDLRVREGKEMEGEIFNRDFSVPVYYPKIPGRFYFLFGRPVETKGKEELIRNKVLADEFYQKIKFEVEQSLAYLVRKREEDPHRNLLQRILYRFISGPTPTIPSFDP